MNMFLRRRQAAIEAGTSPLLDRKSVLLIKMEQLEKFGIQKEKRLAIPSLSQRVLMPPHSCKIQRQKERRKMTVPVGSSSDMSTIITAQYNISQVPTQLRIEVRAKNSPFPFCFPKQFAKPLFNHFLSTPQNH